MQLTLDLALVLEVHREYLVQSGARPTSRTLESLREPLVPAGKACHVLALRDVEVASSISMSKPYFAS